MKNIFFLFMIGLTGSIGFAQTTAKSIDRVVGVVGKYMILESEVQSQLLASRSQGYALGENGDCEIMEQLLYAKLFLAQADKDSVTVTDGEVENELNRRMNHYITNIFKSEEKMEEVYGEPISVIKEKMREDVKEQLVEQRMHQKVTGDIKVTPAEVRAFFRAIPEDSLPLINSEVEIGQIVIKPALSEKAKEDARKKLLGIRKNIVEEGQSFAVLATLYSEDPGSAPKGGLYENIGRGQFVPEFESAAFRLKPGEISEVVETVYGYHIIQLVARRGDFFDVRHILISPKMSQEDLAKAKLKLDSIYEMLSSGKMKFCDAAAKFSEEKETKMNCGLMINMNSGTTRFEIEELGQMDDKLVFMLDQMKTGDFTRPVLFMGRDNKQAYRILFLKNRIPPHKANLKDDYQKLQNLAMMQKQQKVLEEWVNKKIENTYIHIDPYYNPCKFNNKWLR